VDVLFIFYIAVILPDPRVKNVTENFIVVQGQKTLRLDASFGIYHRLLLHWDLRSIFRRGVAA
jgi:hypothetical protein